MYCDMVRLGSSACTVPAKHSMASAAQDHLKIQCVLSLSREIFKFINHYLGPVFERDLGFVVSVQAHPRRIDAMGRNPRCKDAFGNYFGALHGCERYAAGLPTE